MKGKTKDLGIATSCSNITLTEIVEGEEAGGSGKKYEAGESSKPIPMGGCMSSPTITYKRNRNVHRGEAGGSG